VAVTDAVLDLLADISDEDADETYRTSPAFNQSTATCLLGESPLHAYHKRKRSMGPRYVDDKHTRELEMGTMVHKLLLGSGRQWRKLDFDDYRTKDAQAARGQCELAGITPILAPDLERCTMSANRLREQLWEVFQLELNGQSEVPLYWEEPILTPGGLKRQPAASLQCKAKLDHICKDGVTIIDVKSGEANPKQVVRRIMDQMCHVQAAAYTRALVANVPAVAGRTRFIDLFIETSGLTMLTPVAITGSLYELGERQWQRACQSWWTCLETATYPGYTTEILAPEAPKWALENEMSEA
jgi:hypothetical protein